MSHISHGRHDPNICVTWLIHICILARATRLVLARVGASWLTHAYVNAARETRSDIFGCVVFCGYHAWWCRAAYGMGCRWEAWLIHTCKMTHSYVPYELFIFATWLIHMCEISHSYVQYDSFKCATFLIHTYRHIFINICRVMSHGIWYGLQVRCVTHWMCNTTHSYMRHDSFICATWLIHMCDMTHSYVRHDSFICATW